MGGDVVHTLDPGVVAVGGGGWLVDQGTGRRVLVSGWGRTFWSSGTGTCCCRLCLCKYLRAHRSTGTDGEPLPCIRGRLWLPVGARVSFAAPPAHTRRCGVKVRAGPIPLNHPHTYRLFSQRAGHLQAVSQFFADVAY